MKCSSRFKSERIRSCQIISSYHSNSISIYSIYNAIFYCTGVNIQDINRICDVRKFCSIFCFCDQLFLKSNQFTKFCSSQIKLKFVIRKPYQNTVSRKNEIDVDVKYFISLLISCVMILFLHVLMKVIIYISIRIHPIFESDSIPISTSII